MERQSFERDVLERLAGIETAVTYLSEEILGLKDEIQHMRDLIEERKIENGIQSTTLEHHGKNITNLEKRIEKIDGKINLLSKKVWAYWGIGVGIATALSFFLQFVALFNGR